jgi:L-asparagine transporter-like permease
MSKNKNLHDNFSLNFVLRSFNSVRIGLYFSLGAYLLKSSLQNFIADENPMGMLSIEIIEILQISIVFLVALFSSFALLFSARRQSRKFQFKLWNAKTKRFFWIYLIAIVIGIFLLNFIANSGNIIFLAPTFLVYYGAFLAILNSEKKKNLYLISGISLLLAFLVYIIPTYWYSAILIVGASHIVYGLTHRK